MDPRTQVVLAIYGTWGLLAVAGAAKNLVTKDPKSPRRERTYRINEVPTPVLRKELQRRDTNTEFLKIMHDNKIN